MVLDFVIKTTLSSVKMNNIHHNKYVYYIHNNAFNQMIGKWKDNYKYKAGLTLEQNLVLPTFLSMVNNYRNGTT